jgi:hypothetical protein
MTFSLIERTNEFIELFENSIDHMNDEWPRKRMIA